VATAADCSAVSDGFTCGDNAHGCVADVVTAGEGEGDSTLKTFGSGCDFIPLKINIEEEEIMDMEFRSSIYSTLVKHSQ
jgi:hypothetical protein